MPSAGTVRHGDNAWEDEVSVRWCVTLGHDGTRRPIRKA